MSPSPSPAPTTVHQDIFGPDWPLGLIQTATLNVPVSIMSLVDPTSKNDPTASNRTTGLDRAPKCRQMVIQGLKPGTGSHGLQDNTGNIYLVRKNGNRDDYGSVVLVIAKGTTQVFPPTAYDHNRLDPYRYYIGADTVGDSALVTLVIN